MAGLSVSGGVQRLECINAAGQNRAECVMVGTPALRGRPGNGSRGDLQSMGRGSAEVYCI